MVICVSGFDLSERSNISSPKATSYVWLAICSARSTLLIEASRTLSRLSTFEINILIIEAYGSSRIPKSIFEYKNLNISLLPRLSNDSFLKCLFNSKIVCSIPKSDSSPISVYESIALGCRPFVTQLACFDWLPSGIKSRFIFSTSNIDIDAKKILSNLENYEEFQNLNKIKESFPGFYNSLNYSKIAKQYLKIFKEIN